MTIENEKEEEQEEEQKTTKKKPCATFLKHWNTLSSLKNYKISIIFLDSWNLKAIVCSRCWPHNSR